MTDRPAADAAPEGPDAAGGGAPVRPDDAAQQRVPGDGPVVGVALPTAPQGIAPVTEQRRWWRRLWRPGESAEEPAPPEVVVVPTVSLLNRSPFQIGFLGTLGGMLAFFLLGAVVALQSVLILAVLALFVALGLNPLVERLQRWRLPRGLAVAVVALGVVLVVGLAGWAVIPVVNGQVNQLVANMPAFLEGFRRNPQIAAMDRQFGVIDRVSAALADGTWLAGLFGGLLGASRVIANAVFSLLITLVLTLYFLASLPSIKQTIYQLAPASRRGRVRYLANEVFRRVGAYMAALFTVVMLAATTAFVYLTVVGLGEYALALSVVVALFAFVPIVGPTLSTVILSLVAFSRSVPVGIATVIFFLLYQQVDAYLVQPRIYARSVNVPGALVVLAAISGGLLFGIVGALLAIPTMASLLLLHREVLIPRLDRA